MTRQARPAGRKLAARAYDAPIVFGVVLLASISLRSTAAAEQRPEPSQRSVVEAVAPECPAIVWRARVTGNVEIDVVVDSEGAVVTAEVRSTGAQPSAQASISWLQEAALGAARQWRFEPLEVFEDGQHLTLAFKFVLVGNGKEWPKVYSVFRPPHSVEVQCPQPLFN